MDWLKQSPVFFGWLIVCALAGAGEVVWLRELRLASRREQSALRRNIEGRDRLTRSASAQTGRSERSAANELGEAESRLAALRAALPSRMRSGAAKAKRPVDAYFEIAGFVDRMRALAVRSQVAIKPDEYFGFGAFAHHGPDAGLLPVVEDEMQAINAALEILFAAQPQELLGVQRSRPAAATTRAGRASLAEMLPLRGAATGEYFVPDQSLTRPVSGLTDPCLFRVDFAGGTPVLRDFLNGLARARVLLIVRSLEVEPRSPGATRSGTEAAPAGSSAPMISPGLSRFAVVIECAGLAESENASAR